MTKDIKLLIVCQKVDLADDLLGFFHGWIEEFAKHCQQVTVICLYRGEFNLPENVKVLSLGKEKNYKLSRQGGTPPRRWQITNYKLLRRLKIVFYFFKLIWVERKNYQAVFVHMNHEYIVLAGCLWKLMGKKIILWHAHKAVNWKLRLSEKFVDIIVTSTRSGCRLDSAKIRIVGQGINVKNFQLPISNIQKTDNLFKIITVGRISPIKNYETLITAIELVKQSGIREKLIVEIIGGIAMSGDEPYLKELKIMIKEKNLDDVFKFTGAVANKDIASHLEKADLFVNTSLTGSLDKAVLEAMAARLPILTCNEAFSDVLGNYKEKLMFSKGDSQNLAEKIIYILNLNSVDREKMTRDLREIAAVNHNLEKLILSILSYC